MGMQIEEHLIKVNNNHYTDINKGVKKPGGKLLSTTTTPSEDIEYIKHINRLRTNGTWEVYLDGIKQLRWHAANEAEGWVLRDTINSTENGERLSQEVVYGDVVIVSYFPPNPKL